MKVVKSVRKNLIISIKKYLILAKDDFLPDPIMGFWLV